MNLNNNFNKIIKDIEDFFYLYDKKSYQHNF